VIDINDSNPEKSVDENGINILKVVMMVLGILADAIGIYFNGMTNFYWY